MERKRKTPEEIEQEIKILEHDQAVKLARKKENIDNRRLQRLYQLRSLKKKGLKLQAEGYTLSNIEKKVKAYETVS